MSKNILNDSKSQIEALNTHILASTISYNISFDITVALSTTNGTYISGSYDTRSLFFPLKINNIFSLSPLFQ